MSTFNVTFWPPAPGQMSSVPAPMSYSVTAADMLVGEEMLTLVDSSQKVVLAVPMRLNPVVSVTP